MSAKGNGHKKVLGIVGSPRRGGNTDILVDEILRGAEEAGAEVEKISLSKLDIAPCLACDACGRAGKCAQQDDMQSLVEKMDSSQVMVLGTPLYWYGPSAQIKTFIDRWYGATHEMTFEGRRVILAIAWGQPDAHAARHTEGMFKEVLDFLNMEHFATVLAPGVFQQGDVREHSAVLEEAQRVGREVINEANGVEPG